MLDILVRRPNGYAGRLLIIGPSSNICFMHDVSNALQRASRILETADGHIARSQQLESGVFAVSRPPSPAPTPITTMRLGHTPRSAITASSPQQSGPYHLPLEEEVRPLLQKYFANTGMLFPYLHAPTFMHTYEEVLQKRQPVKRTWHALLNMVLAITVSTDIEESNDAAQRSQRSRGFYRRAMDLSNVLTSSYASLETGEV